MVNEILFGVVFLGQIILLSWYLPKRVVQRIEQVFSKYPPSTYPKLYPDSIEYYRKGLLNFQRLNTAALVIGLSFLAIFIGDPTNDDYVGVVFIYFMIQLIPLILAEFASFNYYSRMREKNTKGVRKAELAPRSIADFISPGMGVALVTVYLAFVVFIIYVNQFGYSWFGGYANIAGVTFMNLLMVGIVAWNIYGKKLDPHQTSEDRRRQITKITRQMVFISIVATLYIMLAIGIKLLDMRPLLQTAMSVYFQIIGFVCYREISLEEFDFDVYKDKPLAT